MPIRVLLLDDDQQFRRRLVERLGFAPTVSVVADVGSPAELFDIMDRLSPPADVALIDIGLGDASGIDVADRLTTRQPGLGVLMLTVFEDDAHVLEAIRAGASGYLLKDTRVEALTEAIREVHDGGVPLSRSIAKRILGLVGRPPAVARAAGTAAGELSTRERELLEHVVMGGTESEIAGRLGISPHTVRTHIKSIYVKLRVRSRAAAVRTAFERGLIDPRRR
jgi:DNA-binding NarL/FixJ family response regulator